MKKILLIITMLLLFTYSLSSCKKLNIVEERKIILGEEVAYQTININGEVINIDKAKATTPGQECVFYDGEVCLGGGTISEVIK